MLEFLETYSVSIKLSIIFSLIATCFFYNSELIAKGEWILKVYAHESWWMEFSKVLGMLIIIQGFETSRYIGHTYSAATRIKTIRYAQWISSCIYILFVALTMVVFNDTHQISATSVIDLCRIVAPILPVLLIIVAVMSQFSAAVADTVGSGGLLAEVSHQKITINNGYLFISLAAIALTWITNSYEIITIASKVFAIYYALQLCLTLVGLKQGKYIKARLTRIIFYGALLVLMILTIIFGIPAE